MRKASGTNTLRPPELVAYGCVGTAVVFIIALTLGVFEQGDGSQRLAASSMATTTASP